MKKLLLILLCLPTLTLAQQTYVPDDNFEAYLEANAMGNGIANDDYVTTSNINTLTYLDVDNQNIADLTGIEDFTALTTLYCGNNQLTSLNVSANTALTALGCWNNQLTSLDVSQNTALTILKCWNNQLTSLDVSQNTALTTLWCGENQLTSLNVSYNTDLNELDCHNNLLTNLDLSGATALTHLSCNDNQLTNLDLSNNTDLSTLLCWNNQLTSLDVSNHFPLETLACYNNQLSSLDISYMNYMDMYFIANNNSNLSCIDVDDVTWPTANWTVANQNIDPQHYFSTNCSGTAIEEHTINKELLRTIDLLGRETKNKPLFYIHDDGTVEKKIIIE